MKKKMIFILISLLTILISLSAKHREGCTTALFNSSYTSNKVPILWKNRDTDFLSNKVIFVNEKPYSYIGLVNSKESSGRQVYAGLNSKGFGIMNSVAFNLDKYPQEQQDNEGIIMADALRICSTVEDFENYIKNNLGPALGSLANFGVFDSNGNIYLFEVDNHKYKKFDIGKEKSGYMINSNFARSGKEGKGTGYLRYDRALNLVKEGTNPINTLYILQYMCRDFSNPLLKYPGLKNLDKIKEDYWVLTRDTICREITSCAIVLEGKNKKKAATMWVQIGEPLASIAIPFWVEAQATPEIMYKGKDSAFYLETKRITKLYRPYTETDRVSYMNLKKLAIDIVPPLMKCEKEIHKMTETFLRKKHTKEEYKAFQDKMALKAYECLKSIK